MSSRSLRAGSVRSCPRLLFAALLLGGLLTSGCSQRTPVVAPPTVDEPLPPPAAVAYRLQPGDVIAVRFWGNDELDEELKVRPDGKISLPFIDEVDAAGSTPAELDHRLESLYASELNDPHITVIVREASPPRAWIGGEVGIQGPVPLVTGMTLVQALQQAGGLQTTARRRQVLVIRRLGDGERVARAIDIRPVLSGEDPMVDVELAAGDIVFVPRSRIENVNLFIDQYIDDVIPLQNVFSGAILGNLAADDNEDSPAPVAPTDGAGSSGTDQ